MSLEHFLGLSYEIKLIDFLMYSIDEGYDLEELSDFTGIDEPTIQYFLPRLEYNGIIEVDGEKIRLARNEITSALLSAVYANSGLIASYPDGVDENNYKKETGLFDIWASDNNHFTKVLRQLDADLQLNLPSLGINETLKKGTTLIKYCDGDKENVVFLKNVNTGLNDLWTPPYIPRIKEPTPIISLSEESYLDVLEESKARMEMQARINSVYWQIGKHFIDKYSKTEEKKHET